MRQPVETGRQENPSSPERFERVLSVGTRLRGRHYGQRPCVPHQQVEHTAAPTKPRRASQKTLANGEPSTHGDGVPKRPQHYRRHEWIGSAVRKNVVLKAGLARGVHIDGVSGIARACYLR